MAAPNSESTYVSVSEESLNKLLFIIRALLAKTEARKKKTCEFDSVERLDSIEFKLKAVVAEIEAMNEKKYDMESEEYLKEVSERVGTSEECVKACQEEVKKLLSGVEDYVPPDEEEKEEKIEEGACVPVSGTAVSPKKDEKAEEGNDTTK